MRRLAYTEPTVRSLESQSVEQPHRTLAKAAATGALIALGLTLSGCSDLKVKKPTSDTTPPSLVWNVFNQTTQQQADYTGSPTINAKRGESYRITLKANDPQGVKSIEINPEPGSGEMAWGCIDQPGGESIGQSKTATLAPMTQNLAPDADGMVLTRIFLITEASFDMPCQDGWSFSSGRTKLTGRASNYFGGSTTEIIQFSIEP